MFSPLFPILSQPEFLIRSYQNYVYKSSKYLESRGDSLLMFNNIHDAELFLLAALPKTIERSAEIITDIRKASKAIALRTRQADGNTIVASEDVIYEIMTHADFGYPPNLTTDGWFFYGYLSGMALYSRWGLPKQSLCVIYAEEQNGVCHGPACAIEINDGIGLFILENSDNVLARASDYIISIK